LRRECRRDRGRKIFLDGFPRAISLRRRDLDGNAAHMLFLPELVLGAGGGISSHSSSFNRKLGKRPAGPEWSCGIPWAAPPPFSTVTNRRWRRSVSATLLPLAR